jgi:hypothetical protein
LEAEGGGVFFEAFDFFPPVFLLGFGPDGGVIGFLILDQMPEDPGQFVRQRRDGSRLGGGGTSVYWTSVRQNFSMRASPFSMLAMLVA